MPVTEEYRTRLEQYLASMLQMKKMFSMGILTPDDYAKMDTILAEKYGISSCSLYRGIDLIYGGFRGNACHPNRAHAGAHHAPYDELLCAEALGNDARGKIKDHRDRADDCDQQTHLDACETGCGLERNIGAGKSVDYVNGHNIAQSNQPCHQASAKQTVFRFHRNPPNLILTTAKFICS